MPISLFTVNIMLRLKLSHKKIILTFWKKHSYLMQEIISDRISMMIWCGWVGNFSIKGVTVMLPLAMIKTVTINLLLLSTKSTFFSNIQGLYKSRINIEKTIQRKRLKPNNLSKSRIISHHFIDSGELNK